MAVSTTNAYSGPYTTNGATTVFPFSFTAPTDEEVKVLLVSDGGAESYPADYSVARLDAGGGSVEFTHAPIAGSKLYVLLDTDFTQDLRFEDGSAWTADPVNEGYDRSASRDQVLKRDSERAFVVPLGEDAPVIPRGSQRAKPNNVFMADAVTGELGFQQLSETFKGDPGGNVMAVGEMAAVPAMNIPAGTSLIQTSGATIMKLAAFDEGSEALNDAYVAAWPRFATKSADGRYWRHDPAANYGVVTPYMAGWNPTMTPTETTALINEAIAYACEWPCWFKDFYQDKIFNAVIEPPGRCWWDINSAWYFQTGDLSGYPFIKENAVGSTELTDSAVRTAVNSKNMARSMINGRLQLIALGTDGSQIDTMRSDVRAKIAPNFGAFNCTEGIAAEIKIESLQISGFSYGIFQGDHRGTGYLVLGQTRMRIGEFYSVLCEVPFESGQGGNGFDDMRIGTSRIARCGGFHLYNTDLTIHSIYCSGMRPQATDSDNELETISCSAGTKAATLSAAHAYLAVNDVVAFTTGARNKEGGNIGFVTYVTAIAGTSVTFADEPETDLVDANFIINPTRNILRYGGTLICEHSYWENTFDIPVMLHQGGTFLSRNDKVGGTWCICRRGTPILAVSVLAHIDIAINNINNNENTIRARVGFCPLRWAADPSGSSDSRITCLIRCTDTYERMTQKSDLFTAVMIPDDIKFGGYASRENAYLEGSINAKAECADGTWRFAYPWDVTGAGNTQWATEYSSVPSRGTRAHKEGAFRDPINDLVSPGAGSPVVVLPDEAMREQSEFVVSLWAGNGTQAGIVRVVRAGTYDTWTAVAPLLLPSPAAVGGAWSIVGNDLVWTQSAGGTDVPLVVTVEQIR